MNVVSNIHNMLNFIETKSEFKEGLNNLMEKYNVEDSIFSYNNGIVNEVCRGYFVENTEYNSLDEAISNMNNLNQCIRIINNEKFVLGDVHTTLNENITKFYDISAVC